MSLEGSLGSCPICGTEVKTPDCLQHAKEKLHIVENVPIVTLPSTAEQSWSTLLNMIFDDIIDNRNYRLTYAKTLPTP